MVTKEWMRFFASLKSAEIQEMGALLSGMKGVDKRDAGEEALMQDHINALPDPPDDGAAEILKEARRSAGRCCSCGGLIKSGENVS